MIKVVYKKPNEKPHALEIKNTLEKLQELIEGYIEVIPANDDGSILMIMNEEGKLKGLQHNIWLDDISIVGNVVFVLRGKDGEFESLSEEMIKALIHILN